MYDAIIVGARSAGASAALLLARKGHRVLLVDRATFPSDTPTGHFIHLPGMARLKRWGLLEQIAAGDCPPVRSLSFDLGPFTLSGSPPPVDGVTAGYGPRQSVLGKVLLDAALEAGAELREGFSVQAVLTEGDRVTGIEGRAAGGVVLEHARIVIGADGQHSRIARLVQAPVYHARPSLSANYWSYWSGVPIDRAALHLRLGRIAGAFPTNDGLTCLFVTVPQREVQEFRSNIEGNLQHTWDQVPHLAEQMRAGRREERFYGAAEQPNFFRVPYGPGWALIGDVGYHKDPITGQGISDAFRDAELLAAAIYAGLSGRAPLDQALAGYQDRRDQAALPMYEYTCQLATLDLPPEMQALLAALQGNQEQTDRFFGTIAGTVPPPEFFSPDNISTIIGAAMHDTAAA